MKSGRSALTKVMGSRSSGRKFRSLTIASLFILPVLTGHATSWFRRDFVASAPPVPTAMPLSTPGEAPDRLAEPLLPESPTQADLGRSLYYYHCMPCHGDRGQGLTDEWRHVWVEDHQNCWARGCHTGRQMDAFAIPRFVPPVTGSALGHFQTPDELFAFLHDTQPPQRPGALADEEYWMLTAFLLDLNGRLPAGKELPARPAPCADVLAAATLGSLLCMVAISRAGMRVGRRDRGPARDAGL